MELSPEELAGFFDTVLPHLNELQTRVVTGAMAVALGGGGQARVVEASANDFFDDLQVGGRSARWGRTL